MKVFHYLCFLAFVCSCKSINPDLGLAQKYFPSKHLLNEGVVNKYYSKYIPSDSGKWTYIDVKYHSLKLIKPNLLEYNLYNAAMELEYNRQYQFVDDKMILQHENGIFQYDRSTSNIIEGTYIDWNGSGQVFKTEAVFDLTDRTINRAYTQEYLNDTIIENLNAKKIHKSISYESVFRKDTTNGTFVQDMFYAEGLGLFKSLVTDENGTRELVLVEQMLFSDFEKLSEHGLKRVAYIDPNNTIDDQSNFELCTEEKYIVDYYNGDPDGGIIGRKRTIQKLLQEHLDESKLGNESGYLSFRFVINCKGEAGRFTTEETSLDYEHKEFDDNCVTHLYEIIRKIEKFRPTKLQYRENPDAYYYLTFKLKNGKIIELLP